MTIHPKAVIHPMAFVDRGSVSVGARTTVWQFASVIQRTMIGDDCNIGAGVVLSGPTIGNRCKISSGVVIGPGFMIGNDVFLGPNVVLCNDMWPEASEEGFDAARLRCGQRFAVIVEDGASIGANATILPGVRVGAGAVVAAGAVVDRNVPDGCLWRRNSYVSPVPADRRARRMRYARAASLYDVAQAEGATVLDTTWSGPAKPAEKPLVLEDPMFINP